MKPASILLITGTENSILVICDFSGLSRRDKAIEWESVEFYFLNDNPAYQGKEITIKNGSETVFYIREGWKAGKRESLLNLG